MQGYGSAVEEAEPTVAATEHDVKAVKRRKNKSRRHPMNSKSKTLYTRLDEGDYAKLQSLSDYVGVSPSALSRVFLRQTLSRYSLQEGIDDLVLQLVAPMLAMIPLSRREIEVLNLMAQGVSNKEIGSALEIGEKTVKNHITSIFHKLNADNRTHAVILALRYNLIKPQIVDSGEVSATDGFVDRRTKAGLRMNNYMECAGVKHSGTDNCSLPST